MNNLTRSWRVLPLFAIIFVLGACANKAQREFDTAVNKMIEDTEVGGVTVTPGIVTVTPIILDADPDAFHQLMAVQARLSPPLDGPAGRLTVVYEDWNGKKSRILTSYAMHETGSQRDDRQFFELIKAAVGGASTGLSMRPPKASAEVGVDQRVTVGSRSPDNVLSFDASKLRFDGLTDAQQAKLDAGGLLNFDIYAVKQVGGQYRFTVQVAN